MDTPRICPARFLSDQYFGMWTPHDHLLPFYDLTSNYYRPWKWYTQNTAERTSLQCGTTKEFGSSVENDNGNYKITLDVEHFRPNEITVKVTDSEIIVEGKHEERADTHGFAMRQFKRRYVLPNHCPSENVTSMLSSDGVLIIIAEKRSFGDSEKIVPIKMCGAIPRKTQMESKLIAETSQKDCLANETNKKATNQTVLQEDHSRLLKPELMKDAISEINVENNDAKVPNKSMKSHEKSGGGNSGSVLEGSLMKSHLEMSELAEKMGHHTSASSSETSRSKSVSQTTKAESSSYKSSTSTSSSLRASGKSGELINQVISAELREAAENY